MYNRMIAARLDSSIADRFNAALAAALEDLDGEGERELDCASVRWLPPALPTKKQRRPRGYRLVAASQPYPQKATLLIPGEAPREVTVWIYPGEQKN